MLRWMFITAEEKKFTGHKPMKNRLMLALCITVSGEYKINLYWSIIRTRWRKLYLREQESEEALPSAKLRNMLSKFQKLSDFEEKHHPYKLNSGRAAALFNVNDIAQFRKILKSCTKHFAWQVPEKMTCKVDKVLQAKKPRLRAMV